MVVAKAGMWLSTDENVGVLFKKKPSKNSIPK